MHYINSSPAFEKLFNVGIKLLNDKHRKKVSDEWIITHLPISYIIVDVTGCVLFFQLHVYTKDISVLYKYVPKEILPEEYGGYGGSSQEIIGNHMNWNTA